MKKKYSNTIHPQFLVFIYNVLRNKNKLYDSNLFVCLGNICRPPLAWGIFADLLNKKGLNKKVSCNSAGTTAYHIGENPDPRTIKIAESNDILTNHKRKQITSGNFDEYQYIIVMDRSNLRDIISKGGKLERMFF